MPDLVDDETLTIIIDKVEILEFLCDDLIHSKSLNKCNHIGLNTEDIMEFVISFCMDSLDFIDDVYSDALWALGIENDDGPVVRDIMATIEELMVEILESACRYLYQLTSMVFDSWECHLDDDIETEADYYVIHIDFSTFHNSISRHEDQKRRSNER